MSRPLFNVILCASILLSGCEAPSASLPPARHQNPPQAKLIRYGDLQLYLLRGSSPPSFWTVLHGSPGSESLQKCALTLWNDKTWVTLRIKSCAAAYLTNLIDTLPPPVEHDLCQLNQWLTHLSIMRRARKMGTCFHNGRSLISEALPKEPEAPTFGLPQANAQEVGWFRISEHHLSFHT